MATSKVCLRHVGAEEALGIASAHNMKIPVRDIVELTAPIIGYRRTRHTVRDILARAKKGSGSDILRNALLVPNPERDKAALMHLVDLRGTIEDLSLPTAQKIESIRAEYAVAPVVPAIVASEVAIDSACAIEEIHITRGTTALRLQTRRTLGEVIEFCRAAAER